MTTKKGCSCEIGVVKTVALSDESEQSDQSGLDRGAFSTTMRIDIVPDPQPRLAPKIRKPSNVPAQSDQFGFGADKDDVSAWRNRYDTLFDGIYDAVFIADVSGLIERANQRAADFFCFARQDLSGKNILNFISGSDEELLKNLVSDMEQHRFALLQAYCIRNDGSCFPSEISVNFADSNKESLCFFVRDVSIRKQKEDQLIEQHNALQHAGSGIAVVDMDGVLTYLNPYMIEIWGYETQVDMLGKKFDSLWGEDDLGSARSLMELVVAGKQKRASADLAAMRKDGSVFHVQLLIGRNMDSEGVFVGTICSFVDISERVKTVERLRDLDETKSRFVAESSHELRTPLAIISEFVALVHDEITGPINEKQRECLVSVLRNCERLSTLINTMLDLARIESGKIAMSRKRYSLAPILEDCYKDFLPICTNAKLNFSLDVTNDCPDVYCDLAALNKVMVNLVGNAVKFTPPDGAITISCAPEGQCMKVSVKDTGRGIPEEAHKSVFEAFSQVDREDGPGAKGTGLGLAIVKKLVELNGGMIMLESAPRLGSCFSFTLPFYEKDVRVPPRVLVVDDDPDIVKIITSILHDADIRMDVRSTLSGLESLKIAGEYNPHLVILDINLRDIEGAQIIDLLKQKIGTENAVKVLVISGDVSKIENMMVKGADDYLVKPFDAQLLKTKVKGLLNKRNEETGYAE